jgi:hypothetical protein
MLRITNDELLQPLTELKPAELCNLSPGHMNSLLCICYLPVWLCRPFYGSLPPTFTVAFLQSFHP